MFERRAGDNTQSEEDTKKQYNVESTKAAAGMILFYEIRQDWKVTVGYCSGSSAGIWDMLSR